MNPILSLPAWTPLPTTGAPSVTDGALRPPDTVEDLRQREQLAGQFEGMFVSMLLKEMRSTLDGGLFGGENSDTYGALFDMYLGQHLADSNALGIRGLLLNQWKAQEGARTSSGTGESNEPG